MRFIAAAFAMLMYGCATTTWIDSDPAYFMIYNPTPYVADSVSHWFEEMEECLGHAGPARVEVWLADSLAAAKDTMRLTAYGFHERVDSSFSRIFVERRVRSEDRTWKHEYGHAILWAMGIEPDSANGMHHAIHLYHRCWEGY